MKYQVNNMEQYLYLLPFKSEKHFKIGISSNNFNRVLNHDKTYGVDLSKTLIITSSANKLISTLETELLFMFGKKLNQFSGRDGGTEVRLIKYFEDVIKYIKSKPGKMGYKILNYSDLKVEKEKRVPTQRASKQKTIEALGVLEGTDLDALSVDYIMSRLIDQEETKDSGNIALLKQVKDEGYGSYHREAEWRYIYNGLVICNYKDIDIITANLLCLTYYIIPNNLNSSNIFKVLDECDGGVVDMLSIRKYFQDYNFIKEQNPNFTSDLFSDEISNNNIRSPR